jgi:hypothetical protein
MHYKDFINSFKRPDVVESIRSYLQLIEKTEEGKILINGTETKFSTIEEAREYIKQDYTNKQLEDKASKELYEELDDTIIANIIKEYHNIKVTDTLIESYKEFASSQIFSIDPVVQKIRSINKLDRIVEGKLHYKLNDNTVVAISDATQQKLNNLLETHTDVIDYMRESKDNFMHVITKLEEH